MHHLLAYIFRSITVVVFCAALASAAYAQQMETKTPRQRPQALKQDQPLKQPSARRQPTACSEFGAGFVRMPGSDSCIRFGGSVGIGVGTVP